MWGVRGFLRASVTWATLGSVVAGCGTSSDVVEDPLTKNGADAAVGYPDSWVGTWSGANADAHRIDSWDAGARVRTDAYEPADPPIDAYVIADTVPPECLTRTDCDDQKPCTLDSCGDDGMCEHAPLTGLSCDDGNLCTHTDVCLADGQCKGTSITCSSDPGICATQRVCNGTSSCEEILPGGDVACDDGNPCTTDDNCDGDGNCVGTLLAGWQRAVTVDETLSGADGTWSALHHQSWKVDRPITALRVSGSSDEGGYCYAYWGSGYIVRHRHDGRAGIYTGDGRYYSRECPLYPPLFDNIGTVRICQYPASPGELLYGAHQTTAPPVTGTKLYIKAQHTVDAGGGRIRCYLDYKCD